MEGHHVGSPVLLVGSAEIFLEPLEDLVGVVAVEHALVQVGTVSALVCFDVVSVQRNLPDTYIEKNLFLKLLI